MASKHDIGWEHVEPLGGNRRTPKCKYCGKVIHGGITRLKQHIAHISRQVECNTRSRVRCTVHGTVGAYTNTKCNIVIFWRCNDNLVNPECCNRIRVQLLFSKKG